MLGNGEFLRREAASRRRVAERRAAFQAMTPEQRAAQVALNKKLKAEAQKRARIVSLIRSPTHTGPLTPDEEKIRKMVVARDWDALFTFVPPLWWGKQTGLTHGSPAKYSFNTVGGQRRYIPFTRDDYLSWTMGKWYTVQPGHECSDTQRKAGAEYYVSGQAKWKAANPVTHPNHVFPFYPGGGARDQTYGCQRDKDSWWVKNRKKVVGAVAVVAAVYLGPAVMAKIGGEGAAAAAGGTGATGATGAATTGIVGAGAKAGAITTTVTTKAGAAAALSTKAAGAVATIKGAAEAGTLFTRTQSAVNLINKARTVDAIIKGEMPPPPIGISGSNFTEWALDLAKDEMRNELQERAGEYMTKKMQEKIIAQEEARLRAEIEQMQRELAGLVPPGTPVTPSPFLDPSVRQRIAQMQEIEKQRDMQTMMLFGIGALGAIALMG